MRLHLEEVRKATKKEIKGKKKHRSNIMRLGKDVRG